MTAPDTQPYTIRPATEADTRAIRNVQVTTWKHTYRGMIPDRILDTMTVENPPLRSKAPDPEIVKSRRAFVAVNASDEVVGFAVGGRTRSPEWNHEGELWAIYVLPSEQGRGIGSRLFSEFRRALSKDFKSLIVWVLEANSASHRFYERMGGKRLGFKKPFAWEGEPVADEIAFGWSDG